MRKEQIIIDIEKIITPILENEGIDLVDFELKGGRGNQLLRIFVDVDGGVDINTCVQLSRLISDRLDIEDVMPGRYRLEVSSPGTDRPLKTVKDFSRNIDRQVTVTMENGEKITGEVHHVEDDSLYMIVDGEEQIFPMTEIKSGKVVIKW